MSPRPLNAQQLANYDQNRAAFAATIANIIAKTKHIADGRERYEAIADHVIVFISINEDHEFNAMAIAVEAIDNLVGITRSVGR